MDIKSANILKATAETNKPCNVEDFVYSLIEDCNSNYAIFGYMSRNIYLYEFDGNGNSDMHVSIDFGYFTYGEQKINKENLIDKLQEYGYIVAETNITELAQQMRSDINSCIKMTISWENATE